MTQKLLNTIELADAQDIPAIAQLEHTYYAAEGYPPGLLYQFLAQFPNGLWVAKSQQQVTGYALITPGQTPTEYWLMAALVAEQARGQGIGEQLCQQAIEGCRQRAASKLWLSVAPDNHGAIQLYHKLGFSDAGMHTDFLGPGQHRLLMQLVLA